MVGMVVGVVSESNCFHSNPALKAKELLDDHDQAYGKENRPLSALPEPLSKY